MKTTRVTLVAILTLCALALVPASALAKTHAPIAPIGNAMHPAFLPLDAQGLPVTDGAAVNSQKTCGACHDAAAITAHDTHRAAGVAADCVQCHFGDGTMDLTGALDEHGFLKRDHVLIHEPTAAQCGQCHGVVSATEAPVSIPDAFSQTPPFARPATADSGEDALARGDAARSFAFTWSSGAIYSPSIIADSLLNIEGKDESDRPWDAHAFKLLECSACHFAPNNPLRAATKTKSPQYLTYDPRRLTTAEYLRSPDHRLATSACTSCHDATATHEFLPYKARHLRQVECMACHAGDRSAPVVATVDETVVLPGGGPRFEFRNVKIDAGETFNTAVIRPYTPALFDLDDGHGGTRIGPRNPVTTWRWVNGDGEPVAFDRVRGVYQDENGYRPDVVSTFDADGNGALSAAELRLDSDAKIALIRDRLERAGVTDPRIDGEVELYPVAHGVTAGRLLRPNCGDCHAEESRLNAPVVLSTFAPGGAPPRWRAHAGQTAASPGRMSMDAGVTLEHDPSVNHVYVFGLSRRALVDRLGQWIFGLVLAGVIVHGGLRMRTRRNHQSHGPVRRIYLYSVYERLWHWFMAATVVVLLITGSEIYSGGSFRLMGMPAAVAVHNVFAVLLMVNAFLSLFYHLASTAIRQFIPPAEGLRHELISQIRYYLFGIFQGLRHPVAKTRERKLNPLQQITYMTLLNVLFPVQVISGVLIWGVSRWPHVADAIGGLTIVVPLHHLGSWLFVTFLFLHLYLTTTGHTVLSNIQAMIDGYDLTDEEPPISGEDHERRPQEA